MGSSSAERLVHPVASPLARIRQGIRALVPAHRPSLPPRYGHSLPDGVIQAWHALAPYDRRHLIAVARDLEAAGHDPRVVLAGLLHDIGKVGRLTVIERVANVLLRRLAPELRDRLAARSRPLPGLNGLHLLLHHAERGAEMLDEAGMPADVVWLVRHHEREDAHAGLRALQAADRRN